MAFFGAASLEGLGALRTEREVEVAPHQGEVVVGFKRPELLPEFERMACRVYRVEGQHLVEDGENVPCRALPSNLVWQPLQNWWQPDWSDFERAVRVRSSASVELTRSSEMSEPKALVCSLEELHEWVLRAPEVRFGNLALATDADRRCWVEGDFLPPVRGCRYWAYSSDVFVPLGFSVSPALAAESLRRSAGATKGTRLVLSVEGWEQIPEEGLVPLTRANVRAIERRATA